MRGISTQHTSDWFGTRAPAALLTPTANTIPFDASVTWHAGAAAGHVPGGGEPITLTWTDGGGWGIETSSTLQPVQVAPGFWYPCAGASCSLVCSIDGS